MGRDWQLALTAAAEVMMREHRQKRYEAVLLLSKAAHDFGKILNQTLLEEAKRGVVRDGGDETSTQTRLALDEIRKLEALVTFQMLENL